MCQRIVDRLIAAKLKAALPRPIDQSGRWRDDKEQMHPAAETREQVAAGLFGIRSEAVKTETIDQQVCHLTARVFARHVAIEPLIDDLQLLPGQAAGVLVGRSQRTVVEQLFTPDVRANQRKVGPAQAKLAGQLFLQRTQAALASRGCALGVDDDRRRLQWQALVAFF